VDGVLHEAGFVGWPDPAARLSTLFSLIAEGESWMHELVADARDEGYSWDAIAARLADTVPAARHRYATHAIW
jgi:hypothetical protein